MINETTYKHQQVNTNKQNKCLQFCSLHLTTIIRSPTARSSPCVQGKLRFSDLLDKFA